MHHDEGAFNAFINFQPAGAAVPTGYVADTGAVYGARSGDLTYGWASDNTSYTRDRNSANSPDQRYDTLNHLSGSKRWDIAVPDGQYEVHLVAGDATNTNSVYRLTIEGQLALAGTPTSSNRWIESTSIVTVADGKLTIGSGSGAVNNKISFVEITSADDEAEPTEPPPVASTSTPSAPSGFLATRTSSSAIGLVWKDNSSIESGFKIERKTGDNGTWAQVASVGANVTSYSDSGLASSTYYVYRVRAYNATANSGYSNSDGSTTLAATGPTPSGTGIAKITWSTVTAAPIPRNEGMSAVVNGKMYVFGGVDSQGPILRSDVYTPGSNSWSRLPDLPKRITHAQPVVDGQYVWLVGGYVGTGNGWEQLWATREVWRFDTVSQKWSAMAQLPTARGSGASVLLGRNLHYFGGGDSSRRDVSEHYVLNLDDTSAGWSQRAAMPNARTHLAGAVIGGRIYAIGGQHGVDNAAVCQTEVDVYDLATNKWTKVGSMPRTLSHHTAATFTLNGRIVVLGGEISPGVFSKYAISYNPSTNTWTTLDNLPAARTSLAAGVVNGVVYASGGSLQTTTWKGIVS